MNSMDMNTQGPGQSPPVYAMSSAPVFWSHILKFRMLTLRNYNSNTTHIVCAFRSQDPDILLYKKKRPLHIAGLF